MSNYQNIIPDTSTVSKLQDMYFSLYDDNQNQNTCSRKQNVQYKKQDFDSDYKYLKYWIIGVILITIIFCLLYILITPLTDELTMLKTWITPLNDELARIKTEVTNLETYYPYTYYPLDYSVNYTPSLPILE